MQSPLRCSLVRLVAAFALGLVSTTAGQSQEVLRSNTNRLMLSLALNGTSIDSDDIDAESESGGGFNAQVGWGFTPMFTLLAGVGGARMGGEEDDFVLVHFDILGRFNFRSPNHALVPFVEVGFSGRVAGQDDVDISANGGPPQTVDLEMAGGAFTFGGGVNYFVSQWVALGANIQVSTGEFTEVEFDNVTIEGFEIDVTSARLNLGVTMYPMVRR